MPDKVISEAQPVLASCSFACICGWLSYLLTVQEGRVFKWTEFFLHGAISAVCGYISYEVLSYEEYPPQLCGALSGLAGWGGTRMLKLIEIAFHKHMGVSKEETK